MRPPPSTFLKFLLSNAKPDSDGLVKVTVRVPAGDLERLVAQAKDNEKFIASADSELASSAEPDATESADGSPTPNDASLREIRDQAKRALANLQDRRATLQTITAIIDKSLGEE